MAGKDTWGALCLASALAWAGPTDAVTAAGRSVLVVHLDAGSKVAPRTLAGAKRQAERVLRTAGIEIQWAERGSLVPIDAPNGQAPRLLVRLVSREQTTSDTKICAIGSAVRSAATAEVYYDRILDLSRTKPIDVPVVLGRVIAHEIGHLLLPQGSHSRYGIMRADIDLDYVNPGGFTRDQVQTMRAALAGGPWS